jgi:hypothetical protein
MATGRTSPKYHKVQIDDSTGTLRDLAVSSINDVGLTNEEFELAAFQDAVKGALAGVPDFVLQFSGPFSNLAVQAASGTGASPALSGSYVLNNLPGLNIPLAFGVYFGIQAAWSTGDPVFGLSASAANGISCFQFTVNPATMIYTAKFRMFPGSAVPAWGTSAIS